MPGDILAIETLAIVCAIFFVAAFVKGATGLGFSTSAVGFLALTVGLHQALALLIIPSLTSNILVMREAGHFAETLRRFAWLYAGAMIGIIAGLGLLLAVDSSVPGGILGAVLLVYCAVMVRWQTPPLPQSWERPLAPWVGFATGTVNGLTGSQVMPVLPYMLALGLPPDRFVQAINVSFTVSSLTLAVGLSGIGLMTIDLAAISLIGLAFVFVGVRIGTAARRRLTAARFRDGVFAVLALTGAVLIWRASA